MELDTFIADAPKAANDALDRLFGAAYEEFVRARSDAAKALSGAKQKELARGLKALKKPPLAIWAVNQLARRNPGDLAKLLDVGAEVVELQRSALKGDPKKLLEVSRRERDLTFGLRKKAARLLESEGHAASTATLDRVQATLHAAATGDETVRTLLRRGRLAHEVEAAGFGDVLGLLSTSGRHEPPPREAPEEPEPEPPKRAPERESKKRAAAGARSAKRAAREAQAKARARARALAHDAGTAAREAEALEKKAEKLAHEASLARAKAATARREADRLHTEAEQASAEVHAARTLH